MLIASLGIIFVIQLILWQYFFSLIIEELDIMGRMIKMVSEGRFHEVAVQTISPHNEIEIAIKAISDMARKLEKREAGHPANRQAGLPGGPDLRRGP